MPQIPWQLAGRGKKSNLRLQKMRRKKMHLNATPQKMLTWGNTRRFSPQQMMLKVLHVGIILD